MTFAKLQGCRTVSETAETSVSISYRLKSGPRISHCILLESGQDSAEDEVLAVLETRVGALGEVDAATVGEAVGQIEVKVSRADGVGVGPARAVEQHQLTGVSPGLLKFRLFGLQAQGT